MATAPTKRRAYRSKYPHRIAMTSYSRAIGWCVELNNGDIHRPNAHDVARAYPLHGLKLGMEWSAVQAALEAVRKAAEPQASPCNLHDRTAARFEAEGRAAYPAGRNPYHANTMANSRWAMGWHQGEAMQLESAPLARVHDHEGNLWLVTDNRQNGRSAPVGREYWVQRLHDSRAMRSTVQRGIFGFYVPSLEALHRAMLGGGNLEGRA